MRNHEGAKTVEITAPWRLTDERIQAIYPQQCPICHTRLERGRKSCYVCDYPILGSEEAKRLYMEKRQTAEEAKQVYDAEMWLVHNYMYENNLCPYCGRPLGENSRRLMAKEFSSSNPRCLHCSAPDSERRYGNWQIWDDVRQAVREQAKSKTQCQ